MNLLRRGLTGNQLKLLALIAMTCDHVGLELLPGLPVLRIVGRLAFPIYGWMIAEGCRHTHDPRKYLLRLAELAAVCQVVYFFAMGSLYQCVLVTFFLAACLVFAWQRLEQGQTFANWGVFLLLLSGAFFLTRCLPRWLTGTDFDLDYNLWGILLPLLVAMGQTKAQKLCLLALALIGLGLDYGGLQWFGLLAVPVLGLYNGQRGKRSLGRLFYLYYPAHLVAIFALSLLLGI